MTETTVTVRRRMGATAEDLYETVTDSTLFATVRGIRGVEVLREGEGGARGVGTLRRVNLAAGHLVEEFVDLAPPSRFDYRLRGASVPIDHRFGRMEFLDRGDHTEAVWTSTFVVALPVVGPLAARVARRATQAAFAWALREIDRTTRWSP